MGTILMRAILALLLFVPSLVFAGELIVAGDSDHTSLPSADVTTDHTREALLFRNSMYATAGGSHETRWYTWWTNGVPNNEYLRCIPFQGHNANALSVSPGDCSDGSHKFTATRDVMLTRVAVILHKDWFYRPSAEGGAGGTWNDCRFRFAKIAEDGTVSAITSDRRWPSNAADADGYFSVAHQIDAGQGVGLQLRRTAGFSSCIAEDPSSANGQIGEVQIWGVYN